MEDECKHIHLSDVTRLVAEAIYHLQLSQRAGLADGDRNRMAGRGFVALEMAMYILKEG